MVFARNVFFSMLLSLFIGKVWAALMHCLPYLKSFRRPLMHGSLISFWIYLSGAFDRVSHRGHLLKLKSIGVGGSVLSIWRKNSSPTAGRILVNGATMWVDPNHFRRATEKCVGSSSVQSIYQRNVWAGGEPTICNYADNSIQLAVVRMPATDLPLLSPLTRTWLGFRSDEITACCMILNPNKTMAVVVSRSRIGNPPHDALV